MTDEKLLDLLELRIALMRRGMTQLDLARKLGHPVSTVSCWLRGVAPAPEDLVNRIEVALGVEPGQLIRETPQPKAGEPTQAGVVAGSQEG